MTKIYFLNLALGFLYMGAIAQAPPPKYNSLITPLPVSDKKLEIPVYEDREAENIPYVFWHYAKQKEKQLGLRHPETDSNSIFFRMWITNPIGTKNQPHGLLEIIKDSAGWSGRLFLMDVNFNYKKLSETITKTKIIELKPEESDWNTILDSLIFYKISELPTDDKIPGYYSEENLYNNNTPTYSFEYSTANSYRFFQYGNIYRAMDKFRQPQYIKSILDLLERNFHWDQVAREYFRK
jgi:hypothetical protein